MENNNSFLKNCKDFYVYDVFGAFVVQWVMGCGIGIPFLVPPPRVSGLFYRK